jgi:ArsR family transcriptional regulator, virulence genes transcriptional regulator
MEVQMSFTAIPASDFTRQAGEAVSLLKVMANECRLLVLCYLADAEELSVGELMDRVGLSQSALSQHLARLRDEGLVSTRKEAQSVFYRVCDPRAQQVLALLHQIFCPELGRETLAARQTGEIS